MTNNKRIDNYFHVLSSIKALIDDDLKDVDSNSYEKKLKKFGYCHYPIDSTKRNKSEKVEDTCKLMLERLENKLPKTATGVYVFKELSQGCIDENWNYYSADKNVPSY